MADASVSNQQKTGRASDEQRAENAERNRGTLTRRERDQEVLTPFGFMRRFSDDMDRLFEDFIRNPFGLAGREGRTLLPGMGREWAPTIEVFQRGSEFVVRADLPGLTKDDVDVELNEEMLTIKGERRQEREENRRGVYHSERSYGSFSRSIPLPEGVIPESAQATFKNGVLEITLQAPPSETHKGRKLEIKEAREK